MSDEAVTGPIPGSLPLIVALVGRGGGPFDRMEARLRRLEARLSRPLIVRPVDLSRMTAPAPGLGRLHESAAVVIMLDPDVVNHPLFQRITRSCMEGVAVRDDFRLFVDQTNIDRQAYLNEGLTGHPLLEELIELVQVPESEDPDAMLEDLRAFLERVERIGSAAAWRDAARAGSITLGWLAVTVQVCAAMCILAITAILRVGGLEALTWPAASPWLELLAVGAGVVSVPLLSAPIYLLGLGLPGSLVRFNTDARIRWLMLVGALVTPWANWLPWELSAGHAWILLGFAAGIVLDSWRRNGLQARRTRSDLRIADVTETGRPLPDQIRRAFEDTSVNPLSIPFLSAFTERIAISYARSSGWSKSMALHIHEQLQARGLHAFLDCRDIEIGVNWRSRLAREITGADIFISVLDEQAIQRRWVAAELETALRSRGDGGVPKVIALLEPSLPAKENPRALAVFQRLLSLPSSQGEPEGLRIIAAGENTLANVVSQIRPWTPRGASVLPRLATVLWRTIWMPLITVGALGALFGVIAGVFWAIEQWGDMPTAAWLNNKGALPWVFLALASVLGFTMRLGVGSKFELEHESPNALSGLQIVGSLGFTALLAIWRAEVPAVFWPWGGLLLVHGWTCASNFMSTATAKSRGAKDPAHD